MILCRALGICRDSIVEACHKVHLVSFPSAGTSNTVMSAGSDGKVTELLILQPGPASGPFATLGPSSDWETSLLFVK